MGGEEQTRSVPELRRRIQEAQAADDAKEAAERILVLVAALSIHGRRTRGHAERVRMFTDMLGEELGLPADDRDRLRRAALIHDVGKLAVSSDLLNNAERLSADDWEQLRQHPAAGVRLCGPLLD